MPLTLTSDTVLKMDVSDLAEVFADGGTPVPYQSTHEERQAIKWIGSRYLIAELILAGIDDTGTIDIDPMAVGAALAADGLDRVPCLDDGTALSRIIWCIGPDDETDAS